MWLGGAVLCIGGFICGCCGCSVGPDGFCCGSSCRPGAGALRAPDLCPSGLRVFGLRFDMWLSLFATPVPCAIYSLNSASATLWQPEPSGRPPIVSSSDLPPALARMTGDSDVNSIWRTACMVGSSGSPSSRATLLLGGRECGFFLDHHGREGSRQPFSPRSPKRLPCSRLCHS